jgi:hypothetical protein
MANKTLFVGWVAINTYPMVQRLVANLNSLVFVGDLLGKITIEELNYEEEKKLTSKQSKQFRIHPCCVTVSNGRIRDIRNYSHAPILSFLVSYVPRLQNRLHLLIFMYHRPVSALMTRGNRNLKIIQKHLTALVEERLAKNNCVEQSEKSVSRFRPVLIYEYTRCA